MLAWPSRSCTTLGARLPRAAPKQEPLFSTQRMYSRSSCRSFRFGDIQTLTTTLKRHPQQKCKIVSDAHWQPSARDVLLHNLWNGTWEEEPITKTWARFFPGVPAAKRPTYQYPEPYSEAFWRLYAEPIDDFLAAARMFKQAFDSAALFKESEEIDDGGDGIKPTGSAPDGKRRTRSRTHPR